MGPRRTIFKKPGKGGRKGQFMSQGMKKKLKKERANRPTPTRYQRNIKHIERSQEATQAQKRQIEAERKYRQEANAAFGEDVLVGSDSEEDDSGQGNGEEGTAFEDLAVEFNGQIGQAIDSEDEEESEEDNALSDEAMGEEEEGELGEHEEELEEEQGEDMSDDEEAEGEEVSNDEENDESKKLGESDNEEMESDEEEEEIGEENPSDLSSDEDETETNDPYTLHTAFNLSPAMLETIAAEPPRVEQTKLLFPGLGPVLVELPKNSTAANRRPEPKGIFAKERYAKPGTLPIVPKDDESIDWNKLYVKERIARNITEPLDALQRDVFTILNGYQDLHFAQRSFENADRLRYVYCLHTLNHVLKAASKVQQHTIKLAAKQKPVTKEDAFRRRQVKKNMIPATVELEYRDQGFVRPKVLIVVPFRESALQCVTMLKRLFAGENDKGVLNWNRFTEEYGGGSSLHFPRRNPKPADYERTFAGNIDDNFRLGIAFNRSTMKLYAKYYGSDVMIASPLALRLAIGAKGERDRDYDFLASIELLIIDQADVCYAQNWDHLLHVMEHLHHQPKSTEYTEFSRVREWCLSGWSKFYRQSILLSAFELPDFRSLYNKHFHNYRGKVRTIRSVQQTGTIRQVVVPVPQNFQRIDTSTLDGAGAARFAHFVNVILPQARNVTMARCMIYVPSYFDYVRLRNHFKQEDISFTQICEYTPDAKIARARDMFFHGSKHFLLYSERAHFFRRHRIRGVRHLILYGPPVFPQFYPELVNLMMKENQNPRDGVEDASMTVTVLYTRYDSYQLMEMMGIERANAMIKAPRSVYRFTTDQK
uniref:U3 small nucleolar RNA-associated protein 25 homolog n=1 Tax=Anopheles epiroticus TaxID=199890 RepID=A0A182PLN0_9DIPT